MVFRKTAEIVTIMLVACTLSHAMFMSKETDLQKLDEEIHTRSLSFQNQCCTLYISNSDGCLTDCSSGALIGVRSDNSLCILTSAHSVFDDFDPSKPVKYEIPISFDVESGGGSKLSPFFMGTHFYYLPSLVGHKKFMDPDLAILICKPDVRASNMKPFNLYSGQGYKQNRPLEAAFVGFGPCFDKDGNDVNPKKRRMRLGYTKVFHAPFQTQTPIFQSWLLTAPHWSEANFWHTGYNPIIMNPAIEPNIGIGTGKINLTPHPKQAVVTWGYSGSPLLFNTSRGHELAGIASHHFFAKIQGEDGEPNPVLLMQGFDPVMSWESWIKDVVDDKVNESQACLHYLKSR